MLRITRFGKAMRATSADPDARQDIGHRDRAVTDVAGWSRPAGGMAGVVVVRTREFEFKTAATRCSSSSPPPVFGSVRPAVRRDGRAWSYALKPASWPG